MRSFDYWFVRFRFSFLIIAAFLAWTGYKGEMPGAGYLPASQIAFYWLGAALCVVLGVVAFRRQHRNPPNQ
jgi:hypothetical protein